MKEKEIRECEICNNRYETLKDSKKLRRTCDSRICAKKYLRILTRGYNSGKSSKRHTTTFMVERGTTE